ncbi:MAG: hypothetical protein U1F59_03200 [Candidatus Competibacteraceae bacterium]
MIEVLADLLKQISLGEDSVLELKTVEFSGDRITGPHRNGMADELAAMANTHTGIVPGGVFPDPDMDISKMLTMRCL